MIEAINHDLPFDRLPIAQVAGDLLKADTESRIAAGFQENALSNHEAGIDVEANGLKPRLIERRRLERHGWD